MVLNGLEIFVEGIFDIRSQKSRYLLQVAYLIGKEIKTIWLVWIVNLAVIIMQLI